MAALPKHRHQHEAKEKRCRRECFQRVRRHPECHVPRYLLLHFSMWNLDVSGQLPNQPLAVTVTLGYRVSILVGDSKTVSPRGNDEYDSYQSRLRVQLHTPVRLHRRDLESLPYVGAPVRTEYTWLIQVNCACFRASMVSCRSRRLIPQEEIRGLLPFSCACSRKVKGGSAWFSPSPVLSHLCH